MAGLKVRLEEYMGDYLEINYRETNSKTYSKILIDAIRDIHFQIMNNKKSTEKERKDCIPDYYKKTETGERGFCDWKINRKGMALLVLYLKNMYEDDEAARSLGIENHKYFIENLAKEEELEEKIETYTKEAKQEIQWCFNYVSDILAEMVLYRIKRVDAHWV